MTHPFNKGRFRRIFVHSVSAERAKVESPTLPLSHPKGGSETLLRCFTNKTDILSVKLLQSFFALKLIKAYIAPDAPIGWLEDAILFSFANKVGR